MSRDITKAGKPGPGKAPKGTRKSQEWFERKVAELGEALQQLPHDRQRRFQDNVLGAREGVKAAIWRFFTIRESC